MLSNFKYQTWLKNVIDKQPAAAPEAKKQKFIKIFVSVGRRHPADVNPVPQDPPSTRVQGVRLTTRCQCYKTFILRH